MGITPGQKNASRSPTPWDGLCTAVRFIQTSRFLDEIPQQYVDIVEADRARKQKWAAEKKAKSQSDLFQEIFERKSAGVRTEPVSYDFKAGDMVVHKKVYRHDFVCPAGGDVKIRNSVRRSGHEIPDGFFAKTEKSTIK